MAKDYELNLYQNLIDSLNESIEYYKKALKDESKYKFCIILLGHFVELSLKYLVELQNPVLCFEKPYAKNLNNEKTITWGQAYQILINCKINLTESHYHHFTELATIRNNIIHYKFQYNTEVIRNLVVNIVSDIQSIFDNANADDFYDKIETSTQSLLNEIKDAYKRELHLAQANAFENANGDEIYDCTICGEERTVNEIDGVFHCNFCNEDDRLINCDRCGDEIYESEAIDYGETEYGDTLYLCDYCDGKINED